MSTTDIDRPTPASVYDCALRFTIASRSRPHETHLVDLDAYWMNGMCDCPDFQCRFEKILAQGITPSQAIAQGLVKRRASQHVDDVLRCHHIVEAYRQFSIIAATAISNAKKITTQAFNQEPPPF